MKKAFIALAAALLLAPSIAGAWYNPSYSNISYYPSPAHYSGWCYWNCGSGDYGGYADYGDYGCNGCRPYGDDGLIYPSYGYDYGGYGGYGGRRGYGGYGGYGGSNVYNHVSPTVTVYGPNWGWGWW